MISYADQAKFKQDSVAKALSITGSGVSIGNSNMDGENFSLEEVLNKGRELNFGECNAAKLSFSCGYYDKSIVGKQLTAKTTPDGAASAFQFGIYKVLSDKPTADRKWRDVVAYDKLYDVLKMDVTAWYNNLLPDDEAGVSLHDFRDSFCSYVGITQDTAHLLNDTMTVRRTIDPKVLTGKTVLFAICQSHGSFGRIGRNGNFQYVDLDIPAAGLFPSNTLYPANDLYPQAYGFENRPIAENGTYLNCDYEDYLIQVIDKVIIKNKEGGIAVEVGTGNNPYIIDNFLFYGKSVSNLTTYATRILDKIKGVWYCPAVIDAVGNPCLECGDGIRIHTTDNKDIDTIILKRKLKGIQSLRDTYTADGTKTRENDQNSLQEQINQTQSNVNQVKADLVEAQTIIAGEIQADRARIGQLEADMIAVNQLVATKASIQDLNAVDAKIDNLTAIAITTQNLSAQTISGNQISGGTISGVNINALAVSCTNVDSNGFTFRGTPCKWMTLSSGETVIGPDTPI